jgi:hypothetical protein
MSVNKYIINDEMKLMEMGRREKILVERITTSLIDPSLNRTTAYR